MSVICHRGQTSRPRRLVLAALSSLLLSLPAVLHAQGLPTVKPEEAGLSSQRLAAIGNWLRAEVAQKKIPGAVIMVARGGKVAYLDVVGQRGPDSPAPMKADDIFRIYSMTKPIVSVAALMLVEEGRLLLDAPVARYIPAFGNVKVGVEKTDASGQKTLDLVPPRRPMTVQDLMRHTSGLTYGFFGDSLVKKAYVDAGIGISGDVSTAEFVDKLKATPDGDGTLLDHSLLYWGSGMSNGNQHDRSNPPAVLVGGAHGRMKGNRSIITKEEPTANLLLAIAHMAGAEIEKLGASTGRMDI